MADLLCLRSTMQVRTRYRQKRPALSQELRVLRGRTNLGRKFAHLAVEAEHYARARTFLNVPLLKEGELIGVFGIYRSHLP